MSHPIHFLVKRFRATVINDIWVDVLFFSAVAVAVQLITLHVHKLDISSTILSVLGTVLGLVISFRTSSAYERYQDGNKLWTSVKLASRNLATIIWVYVANERPLKAGEVEDPMRNRTLEGLIEKKTMINLVQAFAVSVKHMLRGEPGVFYQDLYPLVCCLPRYASHINAPTDEKLPVWDSHGLRLRPVDSSSASGTRNNSRSTSPEHHQRKGSMYDPEKALPTIGSEYELMPACNPPKDTMYDFFPPLLVLKPIITLINILLRRDSQTDKDLTFTGKRRKPEKTSSNVPMELNLHLSTYFSVCFKNGMIPVPVAGVFLSNLASLQDSVANLERVSNTPIPFAYQFHLRACLWLYLFFLPFQIRAAYGWMVVPATAFASFLLLGFLEIGQEIEDPFGYDLNDIDTDAFCLAIARELHEITAHPAPDPSTYIFASTNQPFAPSDRRTADEMIQNVQHEYHEPSTGMGSIHSTLLRNWREVNAYTRK